MVALTGGYQGLPKAPVHGLVHVTGGGIPGKLRRILSSVKLGATLHDIFPPCELMLHCQSLSGVSDMEAFRTWNMGNGLLIVTPDPEKVLEVADREGFEARTAGQVTQDPTIKIRKSTATASEDEWLTFDLGE
jgi:phosphoribosylformylglycinamidine cyclo-ligase